MTTHSWTLRHMARSIVAPLLSAALLLVTQWPVAAVAATPTTAPAVQLSPDTARLLTQVRDAYSTLHGLNLAGTVTLRSTGLEPQPQTRSTSFNAVYSAPASFRHNFGDALVLANTPDRLYLYRADSNDFVTADPIRQRTGGQDLTPLVRQTLWTQNPSLLLAIVPDAAKEILDGATKATAEAAPADVPGCQRLDISRPTGNVELLIDSGTHLLRETRTDLPLASRAKDLPADGRLELTIQYARVTSRTDVPAAELAWAPPADAQAYHAPPAAATLDDDPAAQLEGKPAPLFKLNDPDGKSVSLADLKGSVVVLDFWATWCPPCRASLPHLEQLAKDKAAAGVKVYAIDVQETAQQVTAFLKQQNLTLNALLDTDGKVSGAYLANSIPESVVIGKDGVVRKVIIGYSPGDDRLNQAVDKALSE